METLTDFYAVHPFWTWAGLGAALLALEVALGTEYLLWAAASAWVVAVLSAWAPAVSLPMELGLFALLTIVTSLASWKFFPSARAENPDINDPNGRLVGRRGRAVGGFAGGQGRVFVEGKEWAAQTDGPEPGDGDRIEVVALEDGASLRVRKL